MKDNEQIGFVLSLFQVYVVGSDKLHECILKFPVTSNKKNYIITNIYTVNNWQTKSCKTYPF